MTMGNNHGTISRILAVAGLGFAFCLVALPASSRQNQPSDNQDRGQQQPGSQTQAPPSQGAEPQQQDSQNQAPPDQAAPQSQPVPENSTAASSQPLTQLQGQVPPQNQTAQPNQAIVPQTLTLPAGTVIRVRTDEWLSSERNFPGDAFSVVLDQPIVVDGWVVARRGQSETGRVSVVKKSGYGGGTSQLGVQLNEFTMVDGQRVSVQSELVQTSAGGPSNGQKAAVIGTTTGIGAAIGAAADGGPGAAIGAAAGAVAGAIGVQSTRGRPTVIPPESVLSFRLDSPVTISTERGQAAFQPVTQDDYNSRASNARPQRFAAPVGPGYPPPPAYYEYPYAYGYPYAYPYYPVPLAFGFYGGYYGGWGRFGGFRR
jgi:hypothetical protein